MHRAHVLGAALVCYILEKSAVSKVAISDGGLKPRQRPGQSAGQPSQNNAPYGGAAAVALLAFGLLLVTAEPWKVLWGLALRRASARTAGSGLRWRCWVSLARCGCVGLWVCCCCEGGRGWVSWMGPWAQGLEEFAGEGVGKNSRRLRRP